MVKSSTLTKGLKLALALMVAAPLVMATDAEAQRKKRSRSAPKAAKTVKRAKVESWQDAIKKLYPSANPQSDVDKAKSSLYRDPGKAIGLPKNPIIHPTSPTAPAVAPVTLDPALSALDSDGNGSISRKEYLQGRTRIMSPGVRTNRLSQRQAQRLKSQFRRTDLNRDGVVTAEELQASGGGRF